MLNKKCMKRIQMTAVGTYTFIQSDLQFIQVIIELPGTWTHNLLRCWHNALPLSHIFSFYSSHAITYNHSWGWLDTTFSEPIRYQQFWVSADTDIDPIQHSFFKIRVEFLYLSVCWPAHHSFVFYTQSTKYRQLYCKEKQQTNGYVIIIYDQNTFIN